LAPVLSTNRIVMIWDRGLVVRIRLRMYQSGEREMGPVV
jgi:hypothetical protein